MVDIPETGIHGWDAQIPLIKSLEFISQKWNLSKEHVWKRWDCRMRPPFSKDHINHLR